MNTYIVKKYSLAVKKQIVAEYEKGTSIHALHQRYGMSQNTIRQWLMQYSREGIRSKIMVIQTPEEQTRVKELEARVRELEAALAQATLDNLMLNSMVTVAEKEYQVDLKKNFARLSSNKPSNKKSKTE